MYDNFVTFLLGSEDFLEMSFCLNGSGLMLGSLYGQIEFVLSNCEILTKFVVTGHFNHFIS